MIVWCRGCDVTELPSPGVCWTCKFVEAIRRPIDREAVYGQYYSMDVVFDGLAKLWAQRAPRVEYNIVDLKELRKVRDERKMFAVINAAFDKAAAQNFGWPSSSGHNQF